jgi:hypothetical protein
MTIYFNVLHEVAKGFAMSMKNHPLSDEEWKKWFEGDFKKELQAAHTHLDNATMSAHADTKTIFKLIDLMKEIRLLMR